MKGGRKMNSLEETKLQLMNQMVLGAGGQNTASFLGRIVQAFGYVVVMVGGGILIVVGAKTLIAGWIPDQKDIKKIGWGLATIGFGAALMIWGFVGVRNIGQSIGQDFTS